MKYFNEVYDHPSRKIILNLVKIFTQVVIEVKPLLLTIFNDTTENNNDQSIPNFLKIHIIQCGHQ